MKTALLCTLVSVTLASSLECDFEVVSVDDLKRGGTRWANTRSGPVVIKNAFPQIAKSEFLRELGNETVAITRHSAYQSATGFKAETVTTTIKEWTDSWIGNESIRYIFSFLQTQPHTGLDKRMMEVVPLPDYFRRISLVRFVVIGSKSIGFPLHKHQAAWVGLLAGRKRWFVLPPSANLPEKFYASQRTPQELSELEEVQTCYQERSDIVIVPRDWFHATFDVDEWTVGYGSQIVADSITPGILDFYHASTTGDLASLEHFAGAGASRDDLGEALWYSAASGHMNGVELLLRVRASIHEQALHWSGHRGHTGVVKALLAHRADISPNFTGHPVPISVAVNQGYPEILKLFLHHSTRTKSFAMMPDLQSLLLFASQFGHSQCVDALLAEGAIADARSLHFAASNGFSLVVSRLLDHGADAHAKDENGATAFDIARMSGHGQVLDVLASMNTVTITTAEF